MTVVQRGAVEKNSFTKSAGAPAARIRQVSPPGRGCATVSRTGGVSSRSFRRTKQLLFSFGNAARLLVEPRSPLGQFSRIRICDEPVYYRVQLWWATEGIREDSKAVAAKLQLLENLFLFNGRFQLRLDPGNQVIEQPPTRFRKKVLLTDLLADDLPSLVVLLSEANARSLQLILAEGPVRAGSLACRRTGTERSQTVEIESSIGFHGVWIEAALARGDKGSESERPLISGRDREAAKSMLLIHGCHCRAGASAPFYLRIVRTGFAAKA